jgi:hypothetical protein
MPLVKTLVILEIKVSQTWCWCNPRYSKRPHYPYFLSRVFEETNDWEPNATRQQNIQAQHFRPCKLKQTQRRRASGSKWSGNAIEMRWFSATSTSKQTKQSGHEAGTDQEGGKAERTRDSDRIKEHRDIYPS